jgi:uncharacterized membrane protein YccC
LSAPDGNGPRSWWARAARPAPAAAAPAVAARAAVGTALPLVLGLALGRIDLGVFAALGAVHATLVDRVEPARLRVPRMAGALLASALGMLVGASLQHGHVPGPAAAAALTAVALVSGALSATGPRGSAAGMLLLVSASLGGGMAAPHPWWAAAAMMPAGAATVVLLGLPARRRPHADPRAVALAAAYDALGGLLAALGTPAGPEARRRLTARLNQVQDLLPAPLPGRPEPARLRDWRRGYLAALAVTETAGALLWARRPVPPEVAAVPGLIARAVTGDGPSPDHPAWQPGTPALRALDAALRTAVDLAAGRDAVLATAPAPPPPDPWRLRGRLLSAGSLRYGLRVALCIAAAGAATARFPLERAYWVPMTVAFVLKPDLGSVFVRAVSRIAGTLLGVLASAVLLAVVHAPWALAVAAAACVALLPSAGAAHYGLNTLVMTPLALALIQLGGQSGAAEAGPRVLDTLLAGGIVLVLGYLLWPERAPHRIEPRLAAGADALRAYLAAVLAPRPAPVAEVWLRRVAYRALADVRHEVQQGLAEPPPAGRLAAQWLPATAALERLSGAVAAYSAQVRYGGRRPEPAEAARVFAALDRLAEAAAAHRPPTGTVPGPTGPHDPARSALVRAADELDLLLR